MGALFRHEFHPSILREYDIRGVVGKTLFEDDARALGVVFASELSEDGPRRIFVGYDGRLSSPALEQALTEGLASQGASVTRLGCCSTPALYHASHRARATGAIMVTGSHNPLGYNGFKLLRDNRPYYGSELQALAMRLRNGVPEKGQRGSIERADPLADYVAALRSGLHSGGRSLVVVWDNANSSAGPVLEALVSYLPGTHIVLNGEVDGLFPAHHPDPTLPENMVQLREAVLRYGADLGLAFDGDADRLGVLDETGAIIPADMLSLLLSEAVLQERPGAVILGDVKMSQVVFDGVRTLGGAPAMCPSGHSAVKNAMRETGAAFAGEMSGHFFFADRWPGFDDGLYAALRVMEVVAAGSRPLSSLLNALPLVAATPELRFDCPDDRKFGVIEAVIKRCQEERLEMTLIDGVRVREAEGWWLLRASNTQPALVARAEGKNAACRDMLLARIDSMLAHQGIQRPKETTHGVFPADLNS
ncbi:phosphomannomutase/phosphoglucomutase [Asaia krungthepensis]|uniref:Phosphomannomutase n=1 Tax=Asaia krungthepensis NRIC 0535 TaxID=1307925 RepID=A0ABQ0Q1H9_9PROT|nr:phosphomannomutase/phosphoglucomutase [Asaia krungthepensis]GBQ86886.1 phosphomannomutase [Asaia krungthepensis NRIC 0535]